MPLDENLITPQRQRRFLEAVLDERRSSRALRTYLERTVGRSTSVPPPRPGAAVPAAQQPSAATWREVLPPPPPSRCLRIFATDPGDTTRLETAFINAAKVDIPWETSQCNNNLLAPGPVGEYLEVVDVDPASNRAYDPVDLNDPFLLAQDGLPPSEGDPQFHQQMVYAVAMRTIRNFETALGRRALWAERQVTIDGAPIEVAEEQDAVKVANRLGFPMTMRLRRRDVGQDVEMSKLRDTAAVRDAFARLTQTGRETAPDKPGIGVQVFTRRLERAFVQRLRIYPHALREANAYYSPEKLALLFGYFPAPTAAAGERLVFTCLSHDIVAHETTHALLDGLHRRYQEATNPDVLAFHEAFADIVALFQHFTFPELLRFEIDRARGDLRNQGDLLAGLARQFGQARGGSKALRSAIGEPPDPQEYGNATAEPHDRGRVLVAAVFDAFLSIYERRTRDLVRLATGGSGICSLERCTRIWSAGWRTPPRSRRSMSCGFASGRSTTCRRSIRASATSCAP